MNEDLISRQAAIDAVNDVIADYIPTLYGRYEALPLEMASAINRLPPAHPERCVDCENFNKTQMLIPQPEIIRCGECKHRYTEGENVVYNVCELRHNKVQPNDWFCGDAERREEWEG